MKRVVVTGASRGIGRTTAERFAKAGYFVHALGRESEKMGELVRSHENVRFTPLELEEKTSAKRAASEVLAHGTPDVVIHAAGIVERAEVSALDDASWDRQLEVNVSGPFRLTREFLPAMLARREGKILFVSSISAGVGSRGQAAYNASKAAMVALMRCLAEEIADTGVLTAAIAPGAVKTDMLVGSPWPARMSPEEVSETLYFLGDRATTAHNGSLLEMFGV